MKIKYNKKQLNAYLKPGLAWAVLTILVFSFGSNNTYFRIGLVLLTVLYLGAYFYFKTQHYLTIENGVISKHLGIKKSISIADITEIKTPKNQYILKSHTTQLKISTNKIEEASLVDLQRVIAQINL